MSFKITKKDLKDNLLFLFREKEAGRIKPEVYESYEKYYNEQINKLKTLNNKDCIKCNKKLRPCKSDLYLKNKMYCKECYIEAQKEKEISRLMKSI